MVDMLLPAAMAEKAKQSANKDALLKGGASIIKPRERTFRIVQIACGHFHMMALQEDGAIWAWGFGEDGRLGAPRSHADQITTNLLAHHVEAPGTSARSRRRQ